MKTDTALGTTDRSRGQARLRRVWARGTALAALAACSLADGPLPLGGAALAQQAPSADAIGVPGAGLPDALTAQLDEATDIPLDPAVLELLAEAEGVTIPSALLTMLQSRDPRATPAISDFLAAGNPTPQEVAARAVKLSQMVRANPVLARTGGDQAVFDTIGQAVSSTLCAPRVMTVSLDSDYVPPAGVYAYDFGGWNTPLATGFERLTPGSPQVFGRNLSIQENVGDGAVLADAVGGMSNLVFDLPNGDYRVILITTPTVANAAQQPFGASFGVNGVNYFLGTATSDTWWDNGRLQAQDQQAPVLDVGGLGGSIVVTANVVDGTLQLDFDGGYSGLSAVLSGLLIEPAALPSTLQIEDRARDRQLALEECLELELLTQVAMNNDLAPAAGPGAGVAQAREGAAIARGTELAEAPAPFDSEIPVSPSSPTVQ